MLKRILSTIVIGLGLTMSQAFSADRFQEGVHYQTLTKPVVTSDPARVEVLELFWYGCPHCDMLDPALKAWAQQLPSDVLFTRMPVVFGRSWEMHARMFWVATNLGILDAIHGPLFDTIHREGRRLQRVDDVIAFFERYGADPAVVKRELAGFATESALRLADARVRAYGIQGVPALVVNGQFVTGVSQAGGESRLFQLLDELIEKSRQK
ncbi:MAG: thiol:disulfide interchange protein DsbA/DsbL [Pseudomonadota bacterium]|nr:thiol:disulfide interchange protein DsbA/DsbL [Pseudomonadota bacterium]